MSMKDSDDSGRTVQKTQGKLKNNNIKFTNLRIADKGFTIRNNYWHDTYAH
jgi:hypothetical protein